MKVYLSDDADAHSTTQTVCTTLSDYFNYESNKPNTCQNIRHGTPAIVKAIISPRLSDPREFFPAPYVQLAALDGSWVGFTTAISLQPDIPVGTVLAVTRDGSLDLTQCSRPSCGGNWLNLGNHAIVKLLQYHPEVWRGRNLYVRVLDGRYKGRTGWLYVADTVEALGLTVGPYGLDFGDPALWSRRPPTNNALLQAQ
jgi:hypothetical protein